MLMTASVIGIALALPTGLHVLLKNVQSLSGGWDGVAKISLFLKQNADETQIASLREKLNNLPEVADVNYISRSQALEEFKAASGFGEALEALDNNPLPAVIVVTPTLAHSDAAHIGALVERLGKYRQVDIAQLDMQWVKRLYAIMDIVGRGVLVLGVLLSLAVLLIVGNTIRLAIENRREEIVVVKLIGATDAFIRRPFLYTGFWYGLCGGVIALLLVYGALWILSGPVERLAGLYQSSFGLSSLSAGTFFGLLGISILLGWAGSWIAVGRHLRAIEPS
jgi:cell division transport system permease protein